MLKKCTSTLRINQSCSKRPRKMFCFHHFRVSTRCCFQNVPVRVPFSRSTVFKIGMQKVCRFRVNWRPIRHIFECFQNLPASCKRSLGDASHPSSSHKFHNMMRCPFAASAPLSPINQVQSLQKYCKIAQDASQAYLPQLRDLLAITIVE